TSGSRMTDIGAEIDRTFGAESAAARASARSIPFDVPGPALATSRASTAPAHVELPLFGPPIPDDEPLITRPSPPRAPLAVRRATPEIAKQGAEHARTSSFDLELEEAPLSPTVTPEERATRATWTSEP